ncbi:7-carboxy-7-deazaguanine synthase [Nitrosomonas sp. Nm51]|uniref:7-carboxy-7-deazaguanine synthase QueE n=1 Tax=Nitrosomonas sp. Nm51 TaxID=133720 RepID=UPI0008B737CC|nr:7-carboxy-7-deazaguanine synthase QueE [Nitrosomonas sp. Nm51]SER15546.1 7-carboxy-7-deazaguanine synthase [Nitrosomonas sp. Nm51]
MSFTGSISANPKEAGSDTAISLRISEIFFSLQGETSRSGLPTVFVRLTGCPLRCGYCDTAYAFTGGESMTIAAVLQRVAAYETQYVTVTGGEPLAQKACLVLLNTLCDAGYSVSLETSGAIDLSGVDIRVSKVMDIKTPGSGEMDKNRWSNLNYLTPHDEIKFVLCDEKDYQWACQMIKAHHLDRRCPLLLSPVHSQLDASALANWILRDRLPVRMQIQLHKLLWEDGPGR